MFESHLSCTSIAVDFEALRQREKEHRKSLAPRKRKLKQQQLTVRSKRRMWTEMEEERFFQLVLEFGPGNWRPIADEHDFDRTNVQLKDKWRSLANNRDRFADLERMISPAKRDASGAIILGS